MQYFFLDLCSCTDIQFTRGHSTPVTFENIKFLTEMPEKYVNLLYFDNSETGGVLRVQG